MIFQKWGSLFSAVFDPLLNIRYSVSGRIGSRLLIRGAGILEYLLIIRIGRRVIVEPEMSAVSCTAVRSILLCGTGENTVAVIDA